MHVVDQIFAVFEGSPKQLAEATGFPIQTVCDWRSKGKKEIPSWRRERVLREVLRTGKNLSADARAYLASTEPAPLESVEAAA